MKTHQIKLRKANISDLNILKYWDEQPHVIESDPNDDWNWENELLRNPEWREMLIAELDDKPIGFIQKIGRASCREREETAILGIPASRSDLLASWTGLC